MLQIIGGALWVNSLFCITDVTEPEINFNFNPLEVMYRDYMSPAGFDAPDYGLTLYFVLQMSPNQKSISISIPLKCCTEIIWPQLVSRHQTSAITLD